MTIINTPIVTVHWPANVTTSVMFTSISLVLSKDFRRDP